MDWRDRFADYNQAIASSIRRVEALRQMGQICYNICKSIRQPGAVSIIGILAWVSVLSAQELHTAGAPKLYSSRPYLRWDRPQYRNYAYQNFVNYPNHTLPYQDTRRTYFGPMGNYLTTGYDLYKWEEVRTPGQEYGSSIFKPNLMYDLQWEKVYNAMVVFHDGYGAWNYSFIVGDNLIARLSPMTLSMTDFNGLRLDLSMPYLQATALASRIERPHTFQYIANPWAVEYTHFADDSTILLGGRLQADLGAGSLGFNLSNSHVYQSTKSGNSLKGVLRPAQPLTDWVIVRFTDDSPRDGFAGAHIQEVDLLVNGASRPDIAPLVVSNPAGIRPQVGTVSTATGRFRATDYTLFAGHRLYYRGRDELPLFSDYFVRRDHENGEDVSAIANLDGLLSSFDIESPSAPLAADGDREIVFLFDLSEEPAVQSVEIEALLGNDYRVDVAAVYEVNPRGRTYHTQYSSTFYATVARARGNVQDKSNLKRVRFHVGEGTGIFAYSADFHLAVAGLEINGEYARSAVYARYPAHRENVPDFRSSPRFSQKDDAFYVNATHWLKRSRLGAEAFSINPRYTTTYRTFLFEDRSLERTNLDGMLNHTLYWDLVEDNDDGDRFPDRRYGNLAGFTNDRQAFDLDGVHLAQDEDNDGFPDSNSDGDPFPDYEEPFLMYNVEPNTYVYGLDRNHNDEPDSREDDGQVDYPYDPDQRGYHLFAQLDLTPRLSFGMGHYSVNEIAGSGRNHTSYALLTLDVRDIGGRRLLFAENNFRRVRDDIADEYIVVTEIAERRGSFSVSGLQTVGTYSADNPPIFRSQFVADLLQYQDSFVNETYFDLRLMPWAGLRLGQKLRARFNWQRGGRLHNQTFQVKRRLDFWTSVSRAEFALRWGKLSATPRYKFMLLRLADRERGVDLISEYRSIPILRLDYQLLERTSVRVGLQGFGPIPYRLRDQTARRESFEQRTAFATITNRTRYFGYELVTVIGVHKDHRDFDTDFQDVRNFDSLSLFVRALVGFTEYGRPI